jgi:hypothetical protein
MEKIHPDLEGESMDLLLFFIHSFCGDSEMLDKCLLVPIFVEQSVNSHIPPQSQGGRDTFD